MHANKQKDSIVFRSVNLNKYILNGLYNNPDDETVWQNILQLMYLLRQSLSCKNCRKLLLKPYTPTVENCHRICMECKISNIKLDYTCNSCKLALSCPDKESSFVECTNYRLAAECLVKFCRLIKDTMKLDESHKWSKLRYGTQNDHSTTLPQLVQQIADYPNSPNPFHLGNSSEEKITIKKGCRCGSGPKKGGKLTCIGQRCACYKNGKLIRSVLLYLHYQFM